MNTDHSEAGKGPRHSLSQFCQAVVGMARGDPRCGGRPGAEPQF